MAEDPRIAFAKPDTAPAKKTVAKKTVAKKTPGTGPAATLAKGGGPENPAADVAAVKAVAEKAREHRAQRAEARAEAREGRAAAAFAQRQSDRQAKQSGGGVKAPKVKRALGFAWSGNRKLLTVEFLLCVLVLGLGTVTAAPGSKDDVHRAMVKGSALSGLFVLLALTASGGKGAARAATALGTLVTAAYLFTSSDVHNVASWVSGFFGQGGPAWKTSASSPDGSSSNAADNPSGKAFGPVTGTPPEGTGQSVDGTNEGYVGPGGAYTSTTGFGY